MSTPTEVELITRATGELTTAATKRMEETLPWFRQLTAEQRSWVGLVAQAGIAAFDMRCVDEIGMRQTLEQALAGVDAGTHLHVSLDVDFLDPEIAQGVGTPVRGGPTYREAQLCMEMIADTGRLSSLDIMELNPAFDHRNTTAELAVDLVESLFGKSTLIRPR